MTNRKSTTLVPFGTHFSTLPSFFSDEPFKALEQLAEELISPRYRPRLKEIYQTNSKFPSLEVLREGNNLTFNFYVAGYDKDKISVEYDSERQALVVSGERETSEGQNDSELYYSEVRKSNFERRVPVPKDKIINLDEIKSKFQEGILSVSVPYQFETEKKLETKRKKITIE